MRIRCKINTSYLFIDSWQRPTRARKASHFFGSAAAGLAARNNWRISASVAAAAAVCRACMAIDEPATAAAAVALRGGFEMRRVQND